MKVNNIYLESILCKVDHSGRTNVFITIPLYNTKKLGEVTYLVDFQMVPNHVCAILELLGVAEYTFPESAAHARQVREVVTKFQQDTDYLEGKRELSDLLTRFHETITLLGDPFRSTTLVQHHIPLKPDRAPVYIPAYRFPHSRHQVLDKIVEEMLEKNLTEPSNSP